MMNSRELVAVVVCLVALGFGAPVQAQTELNLFGEDLTWSPGSPSTMTLTINRTSLDPQLDRLAGWSVRLEIIPEVGATGTLEFASATLPDEYLLAGVSGGLVTQITGGTKLFAFDDDPSFQGVTISPAGGNLLELAFLSLDNALGSFGIWATPGLPNTQWSDQNFNDRAFANIPFSGPAVRIGTVSAVPEPGSLALCGLALATGAGVYCRQRHKQPSAAHQHRDA